MQTFSVDQLVGQTLGNYRLERFLGRGRLNAVYLARHLSSQRTDALTFYMVPERFTPEMRTHFMTRFFKEAAAVTSLSHEHILPVYEYGEQSGLPYLVTPYMMHGSLADLLKKNGRYDYMSVLSMLEQLVSGLSYAHQRRFVHGTLKPANVVLSSEDTMQVAGFGLMHMLQLSGLEPGGQPATPNAHLLSIAGTFLAAPEYIAPEIVQGQSIDIRSDVYALGCILFELLSGQPPFSGTDPLAVARQHTEQNIPFLRTLCPEVPLALASVVNQALERDPTRRFQNVRELAEAFTQASHGATGSLPRIVNGVTPASRQQTRLQETPPEGFLSNKWQLMPPIVTGKLAAINLGDQHTFPRRVAPAEQQMERSHSAPLNTTTSSRPLPASFAPPTIPNFEYATTMPPAPHQNDIYQPERQEQAAPRRNDMYQQPAAPRQNDMYQPPAAPRQNDMYQPQIAPQQNGVYQPERQERTAPRQNDVYQPERRERAAPAPQSMNANSMPGANDNTSDLVKAYSWWSQSEDISPPPPLVQPVRQAPPREPLQLGSPETINWTNEPFMPDAAPARRNRSANGGNMPAGKVSRRRVMTLLGTGAVAAAGVAVVLNLGHLLPQNAPAPVAQGNANVQPKTGNGQPAAGNGQPKAGNGQPAAGNGQPAAGNGQPAAGNGQPKAGNGQPGHTGTVVGQANQTLNTAADFKNPANNQPSLLVHLAGNTFAAYEQACTHEGVLVNYDPATKRLVCPAHGAIFDPANKGAVLVGPNGQAAATIKPLPNVKVTVNADGTITI